MVRSRGFPLVRSSLALTFVLTMAEVLNLIGSASFPALLPEFRSLWSLTNSEAGWISGIYHVGYISAVPLLVSLTDRLDARRIYLFASAVGALSHFGFGFLAEGFWSALGLRALGGIGLAGTYMVGLRLLSDRVTGPKASRSISIYTAHFAIGTALSVLLAGEAARFGGWQSAFYLAGAACLSACLMVGLLIRPIKREKLAAIVPLAKLLDPRPLVGNRPAFGYILGYGGHVWELFGVRSWLVAFLVAAVAFQDLAGEGWSATRLATLLFMLGLPASFLGNELALRFGRRRVIIGAMGAAAALSLLVGYLVGSSPMLLLPILGLYVFLLNVDSGALTAGVVECADPGRKGATMAFHSLMGFAAGSVSPLVFGLMLDWGALWDEPTWAWGLAFSSLALGPLLGILALVLTARLLRPAPR
ncbi:MFS transporter [Limibacillus sp. MBR-115]|uniref:MFS transporter n=1 Tax=Limibacillus sp. MBR-115 TaxID=3156465 RepID=UPI003394EA1D